VTTSTVFPLNHTTKVTWKIENENLGYGEITLKARGALSVDNEVIESVKWLFPTSFLGMMTSSTQVKFHTYFSYNDPTPVDQFGIQTVSNITLNGGKVLTLKNGTVWGKEWDGSGVVKFVESGALPSILVLTNIQSTSGGKPVNITVNGDVPAIVEIGSEEGTSTVRNDDIITSLTFAIILFMVVDLGSYDSAEKCKYEKPSEETKQPNAKANRQRFR